MGPIMETILISLYATICCLGILSNTALIWVVLGKYKKIIKITIKQTLKSSYSYLIYDYTAVGNINFLTFSLRHPLPKREAQKIVIIPKTVRHSKIHFKFEVYSITKNVTFCDFNFYLLHL